MYLGQESGHLKKSQCRNYNSRKKTGHCKGGRCGEVAISGGGTVLHQRWLVHIVNTHKQTNKQCIIISTACSNPPQGKSSPNMDLVVILHTQHTETGFLHSQMGQPWLLHIIWLISEAKKLDRAVKQKLKPDKQNITQLKLQVQLDFTK